MKKDLLEILVCPSCRTGLEYLVHIEENGEIKEGELKCNRGHIFLIKNFLPYFSKKLDYVDIFDFIQTSIPFGDFENKRVYDNKCAYEITEKEFIAQTKLDPKSFNGKLVLDVGCGGGRFVYYLNQFGARIVGIDLRYEGLARSVKNFKQNDRIHFAQADLFNLPFKEKCFDFIYSFGVLHHTPDPKKAFVGLTRFLKPGADIAVWVYPKSEKTYISDKLRFITRHMPKSLLYILGLFITSIYAPFLKIPKFNNRLKDILYRIRLPWYDHWNWRIHSFMDWYGPMYQSKHTYEELKSWFEESGLGDILLCPYPVSVRGTLKNE